jgi:hypothetical protein
MAGLARTAGFELSVRPDPVLGRPLPHYTGIPLLVSDWITDTESGTKTSVYLVILSAREGEPQLGGLVWGYNPETGAGIRVGGPYRTNASAADLLFSTLELNLAFASLSTGSVLRLSNVTP